MSELSRLVLKAVRSLPPEEQDTVMQELLDARLLPWRDPAAVPLPEALPELLHRRPFAHPRVELAQAAAQFGSLISRQIVLARSRAWVSPRLE